VHQRHGASGSQRPNVPIVSTGADSATITAAATGFTPGNRISPSVCKRADNPWPNPLNMGQYASATLAVTLSSPAGGGGQVINLATGTRNAATVPPAVTIPQGSTSAIVTLNARHPGSTIITASAGSGFCAGNATVKCRERGTDCTPANVTVGPAQTASFPVTLATPAPRRCLHLPGLAATRRSLTVSPTNFLIPAGATAPISPPKLSGIKLRTSDPHRIGVRFDVYEPAGTRERDAEPLSRERNDHWDRKAVHHGGFFPRLRRLMG